MEPQRKERATQFSVVIGKRNEEIKMLKGIVLWAMGVPLFVIILLYLFIF